MLQNVCDVIAKFRKICTHFHHSPKVSTRWNSTYLMLSRALKTKRFLQAYCGDHSDIPTVSANEWKITENLVILLEPFFDFTKTLSSDGATISVVIPNILALDHFLSKLAKMTMVFRQLKYFGRTCK